MSLNLINTNQFVAAATYFPLLIGVVFVIISMIAVVLTFGCWMTLYYSLTRDISTRDHSLVLTKLCHWALNCPVLIISL